MVGRLLNQVKASAWSMRLAALQVQFNASLIYLNLWSTAMLALTFWHTTGGELSAKYAPWMNIGVFALCWLVWMLFVMWFDYKFVLPARQGFMNVQAVKHENPAMALMEEMRKTQLEIQKNMEEIHKTIEKLDKKAK